MKRLFIAALVCLATACVPTKPAPPSPTAVTITATFSTATPIPTITITVSLSPVVTIQPTPEPGTYRMRGVQLTKYGQADVIRNYCYNKYFYWEVNEHGMIWREDMDGEVLCLYEGKIA